MKHFELLKHPVLLRNIKICNLLLYVLHHIFESLCVIRLACDWFCVISFPKYYRFKLKYHPEDAAKRKEEQRTALNSRVEVFSKFLKQDKFDNVSVDNDQSDSIVKLLDSVVILLEGGTDFDLQVSKKRSNKFLEVALGTPIS